MPKPLSGKRYYAVLGQRDASMGLPVRRACINQFPGCWPEWAKNAYHLAYWPQSLTLPPITALTVHRASRGAAIDATGKEADHGNG